MSDNSNTCGQPLKNEGLSKAGILRGHDVFQKIMKNPVVFSGKYLKAFADISRTGLNDSSKSPLFTSKVKVGFIVAKRRVRKAVQRNRIKRLMKEDYRRFKATDNFIDDEMSLIFSLTDHGYEFFRLKTGIKSGIFANDLILISGKIVASQKKS